MSKSKTKKKNNIKAKLFSSKQNDEPVIKSGNIKPIAKAEQSLAINDDGRGASNWISTPFPIVNLQSFVDGSTILPRCIESYKTNIAGFGVNVKYKDEYNDQEETAEMLAEYNKADLILNTLCIEKDIKDFFGDIIEHRETFGAAYVEAIRNYKEKQNEVSQLILIDEPNTITKTIPLAPAQEVSFSYKNEKVTRLKEFRKYKQEKNGKTIFFKEFGDKRIMNALTGEYVEQIPEDTKFIEANEIIEFSLGTRTYGLPRWYSQTLCIDGSRKAEELNHRYFTNGRHNPLGIIVSNGTLTEDSEIALKEYAENVAGEKSQHQFLLLELEGEAQAEAFEESNSKPNIEIKDLSPMLQKDALFQEYQENNRRKIQSSFGLPDLYTGYTSDYNRATSEAAIEITEKQVFIPERRRIAWIINNLILKDYMFKYVEVEFKAPDVSNIEDLAKILSVCFQAGGVTPNKAKEIIYGLIGEESEDYEGDWGNIPVPLQSYINSSNNADENPLAGKTPEEIQTEIDNIIQKSVSINNDTLVPIMKSVRDLLIDIKSKGMIK